MSESQWSVGQVVQINPEHDEVFGGCLMVITDPKSWGAQGYVTIPGKGAVFYRCPSEQLELIGQSVWMATDEALVETITGVTIVNLSDTLYSAENPGSEHEAASLLDVLRVMAEERLGGSDVG